MAPPATKADIQDDEELSDEQYNALKALKEEHRRAEIAHEIASHRRFASYYEMRRDRLKSISKFWPTAFSNHKELEMALQHRDDILAFSHLTDFWVERSEKDPRIYTLEFHFSENPFFSSPVLKKEYKYEPSPPDDTASVPSTDIGEDGVSEAMIALDWDADVKPQKYQISWKSDSKNLTKLYPRKVEADDPTDVLEYGSFFNFFELQEDPANLGSILENDLFPDAIEYFLGKGTNNRDAMDEDSQDEDDSADDNSDAEEIDLERPKKKVKQA
ncbi:hypothetical protein FRC03_009781 [Tulasnella sp. 419]|nr:hypothetical protein FRC03_009781 [Tulasnella sp. 419]